MKKLIRDHHLFLMPAAFPSARPLASAISGPAEQLIAMGSKDTLQPQAYLLLDNECNVCRSKKPPFMVLSNKLNGEVLLTLSTACHCKETSARGAAVRLSPTDSADLQRWLFTLHFQ